MHNKHLRDRPDVLPYYEKNNYAKCGQISDLWTNGDHNQLPHLKE
jgi:hypothetical protein